MAAAHVKLSEILLLLFSCLNYYYLQQNHWTKLLVQAYMGKIDQADIV